MLTKLNESNLLKQIALKGYESYENEVVTLVKNYPWPIDLFLDIGANIGFYSILAECYFPQSTKIIAVEPFPRNYRYIKNIKKINNLNFEIIEKAVDKTPNMPNIKKTFYYPTASSSSNLALAGSLINSFRGTGGIFDHVPYEHIEVFTTTLPLLLESHDGSCLIKLDCEGNELPIIESSFSVLEQDNVDFIIEIGINDSDKNRLFSIMAKYGYEAYLITNAGLVNEDRPLTFPKPAIKNRTIWANHFFSKKKISEIKALSLKYFGYWI